MLLKILQFYQYQHFYALFVAAACNYKTVYKEEYIFFIFALEQKARGKKSAAASKRRKFSSAVSFVFKQKNRHTALVIWHNRTF